MFEFTAYDSCRRVALFVFFKIESSNDKPNRRLKVKNQLCMNKQYHRRYIRTQTTRWRSVFGLFHHKCDIFIWKNCKLSILEQDMSDLWSEWRCDEQKIYKNESNECRRETFHPKGERTYCDNRKILWKWSPRSLVSILGVVGDQLRHRFQRWLAFYAYFESMLGQIRIGETIQTRSTLDQIVHQICKGHRAITSIVISTNIVHLFSFR